MDASRRGKLETVQLLCENYNSAPYDCDLDGKNSYRLAKSVSEDPQNIYAQQAKIVADWLLLKFDNIDKIDHIVDTNMNRFGLGLLEMELDEVGEEIKQHEMKLKTLKEQQQSLISRIATTTSSAATKSTKIFFKKRNYRTHFNNNHGMPDGM